MKIYNRIAVLRAESNISRQQLADKVDVNVQTIGFIERGDYYPSLELAFALAEALEADIETLFATEPFKSVFKRKDTKHGT